VRAAQAVCVRQNELATAAPIHCRVVRAPTIVECRMRHTSWRAVRRPWPKLLLVGPSAIDAASARPTIDLPTKLAARHTPERIRHRRSCRWLVAMAVWACSSSALYGQRSGASTVDDVTQNGRTAVLLLCPGQAVGRLAESHSTCPRTGTTRLPPGIGAGTETPPARLASRTSVANAPGNSGSASVPRPASRNKPAAVACASFHCA
jgi:hypothetical protein